MKIGILGTRGIPNYHGGFEQFAEFFASFLSEKGHDVYVYSSHSHPYKESSFNNARIIHCYDPEEKIGTVGQFFYDLNCIRDSRKRKYDIVLQLGYTSSSIWHRWLPKEPIIISNMDGLEWKRSKYNKWVRKFLKYAESLAVKSSDYLISDSIGIQNYLKMEYNVGSKYIAYGAEKFEDPNEKILDEYEVRPYNYNMLIARMEPENNIETILDGATMSDKKAPFLVIGKCENSFGKYLMKKFEEYPHIRFLGGIYKLEHLNNLRYFSNLYFHGHSVGGTNPSLLEAMASNALIVAHNNEFNRSILGEDAYYFKESKEVTRYIDSSYDKQDHNQAIINNFNKIDEKYSWPVINQSYLRFFQEVYANS
jgi:glycosyltransferase involved in cell wall biosynthesis